MVILYVDDDIEDIEIFRVALKAVNPGFQCLVAQNGKVAMEILHADLLPDFIFLDINMPVINGKTILTEIRRDKKFESVPIVMYSTTLYQTDIEEFKKSGANLFLKKQNHFQDLCDELSAILVSR
jgi:CheY-like chemotaxis protein